MKTLINEADGSIGVLRFWLEYSGNYIIDETCHGRELWSATLKDGDQALRMWEKCRKDES